MPAPSLEQYRPLHARTLAAVVGAGLGLASALVDVLTPGTPLDALKSDALPSTGELVNAWLTVSAGALELVTLLAFVWGAARNAAAFGKDGLRFTPFTSVAWFFMPIANLWMFYRAVSEVWRASDPATATSTTAWRAPQQPFPTKVLAWWLVSLATIVGDDGPTALGAFGAVLAVVSSGLFVHLAFELRDRQQQSFDRLSGTVRPLSPGDRT